jgi:hypothetical protein
VAVDAGSSNDLVRCVAEALGDAVAVAVRRGWAVMLDRECERVRLAVRLRVSLSPRRVWPCVTDRLTFDRDSRTVWDARRSENDGAVEDDGVAVTLWDIVPTTSGVLVAGSIAVDDSSMEVVAEPLWWDAVGDAVNVAEGARSREVVGKADSEVVNEFDSFSVAESVDVAPGTVRLAVGHRVAVRDRVVVGA